MKVTNKYRVARNIWAEWSPIRRRVFNYVLTGMGNSPGVFQHPNAPKLPSRIWFTTAWNAAWIAGLAAHESSVEAK